MVDRSPTFPRDDEKADFDRARFQSVSTDNALSPPVHKENVGPLGANGAPPPGYTSSEEDINDGFTPEEQKAIIRRVDRRLVITVGAMYCVSLMDRTNMSYANIAGMVDELQLTGFKYGIANLVFFIPYILFQPPSTVLVRKLGPRLHLSLVTMLWGAVMIGMGFAKDFATISALRAVLGLLEAGFFPACVYLLSTWYTRYEVGKRYAVFYLLGSVAAAFSGILAYGFTQLKGREGLSGWRWIFILEGVMTCALALVGYWLLVDFPDSSRDTWSFIGAREKAWIVRRIQRDRGDSNIPPFAIGRFLRGGADWKIWAYAMIFFNTTTLSYALAFTLPPILMNQLGFDLAEALCLAAPPYAFAAIIMLLTGWFGDKYHVRGPVIVFHMILCLVGLPIMGFHPDPKVRYFGVFLVTAGANSNVPAIMSFQANNVRGQWKRAFCSATLVGFGGIGGIAGSLVFREQDAATGYKPGFYACIACCCLTLVLLGALELTFRRENAKADRGEKVLEINDGDGSSDFRYTY